MEDDKKSFLSEQQYSFRRFAGFFCFLFAIFVCLMKWGRVSKIPALDKSKKDSIVLKTLFRMSFLIFNKVFIFNISSSVVGEKNRDFKIDRKWLFIRKVNRCNDYISWLFKKTTIFFY